MTLMKKIIVLFLCTFIWSCTNSDNPDPGQEQEQEQEQNSGIISACGIEEPQKNISWLTSLIRESDKGEVETSVIDTIWLERYKGSDVFVASVPSGNGVEGCYLFNCDCNTFIPDNVEDFFKNRKKDKVLYSNFKNDLQNLIRTNSFPKSKNMYVYPIQKDSEELSTMYPWEKLAASQLPEDVLKSISTIGLLCSFINTPNIRNLSFQYLGNGAIPTANYFIYPNYNHIEELFSRTDADKALLACYEAVSFDYFYSLCRNFDETNDFDIQVKIEGERVLFKTMLCTIEVLFTRKEILDQLDSNGRKEAARYLLRNAEHWQKITTEFEVLHDITSFPVLAYVMYEDGYPPVVEYFYIEDTPNSSPYWEMRVGYSNDLKVRDDIISFAKNYIK